MSDEKPETPAEPEPAPQQPRAKQSANPKTKPIPVVGAEPAQTQPTAVIEPVATAPTPVESDSEPEVVVVAPPRKKRRRWPVVLGIVLLVLAILLTIAYFVGEAYAKDYARDYIKQRIVAVLGIKDPSTVKVDIGTGSVLLQALAGRVDNVDVTASEVTFGTLTGAATVHAEGVPLDADAKTQKLDVTFSMPEEQVQTALGQNLSGLKIDSVTLEEPEIVVKSTLNVFIFQLPVAMGIVPSAEKGLLVFTPTTVTLDDKKYTVDELRQQIGSFADPLLAQKSVCVNESLPVALKIVDVDVVAKDLVLKINGDGVALGGSDLSTPGTCAG
jgi:LmeA-like phospholipid-binding